MPTVKGVLQKYHDGQNIFRREAVACLVARIEKLEAHIASQQKRALDEASWDCSNCENRQIGACFDVCPNCDTPRQ